jgi:hypothetical protein
VIQALSSLKKKVYVVSADGDFEGASKNVLQVKNLSELLHLYNSHTDVVADFVQKLVLKNRAKLLPWIQAGLEKIPARLKDSDGQIRFGEMHLLDITDAWVVSFKKGSAEVSVEFKFQISCQAMELDESGYIADLPSFEEEHASQAQIQVRFNPKNESVFHFHGLRFSEDLESGIEIGGAAAGSPRRKPWENDPQSPSPGGAEENPRARNASAAPPGLGWLTAFTHGLRRGLPSVAAPQLNTILKTRPSTISPTGRTTTPSKEPSPGWKKICGSPSRSSRCEEAHHFPADGV